MKDLTLVLFYDADDFITSFSLDFPLSMKDMLISNLHYIKEANAALFVRLFDCDFKLIKTTEE